MSRHFHFKFFVFFLLFYKVFLSLIFSEKISVDGEIFKVLDEDSGLCLYDGYKVVLVTIDLDTSNELLYDGKEIKVTRDVIDTYSYVDDREKKERVVPVIKL